MGRFSECPSQPERCRPRYCGVHSKSGTYGAGGHQPAVGTLPLSCRANCFYRENVRDRLAIAFHTPRWLQGLQCRKICQTAATRAFHGRFVTTQRYLIHAMSRVLQRLQHQPRLLFLFEAIGALATATFLILVLSKFETIFRVPLSMLWLLSGTASFFAVYSLGCFLFFPANWRPFLKTIAIANLMYCGITAVLVIRHFSSITLWSVLYFIVEIPIVVALARFEWKTSKQLFHRY